MTDEKNNIDADTLGIYKPALVNWFRIEVDCPEIKPEITDTITLQTVSMYVKYNPLSENFGFPGNKITLVLDVDTEGKTFKAFNSLKNNKFNIIISNLDGNGNVLHTEHYYGCLFGETSWSHDYASPTILKLKLEIPFYNMEFKVDK